MRHFVPAFTGSAPALAVTDPISSPLFLSFPGIRMSVREENKEDEVASLGLRRRSTSEREPV